MTRPTTKNFPLRAVLIVTTLGLLRSACAAEEISLSLSLTSGGNHEVRHAVGRPIVLELTLSNPTAMNQFLDAIAKTNKGTGAPHGEIPQVVLGDPNRGNLFSFTAKTGKEQPTKLTNVQVLAAEAKRLPSSTTLDGRTAFRCIYGMTAKEMNKAAGTTVTIIPHLAVKPAGVASVSEEPLRIHFVSEKSMNPMEKANSDYSTGEYYLLNEQYREVEASAQAIEKTFPQLAASLRAQMFFGLGDTLRARQECRRAISLYTANSKGESNPEPPVFLFEILKQIDRAAP